MDMNNINAQLVVVEAKLAKDPTNAELLSLKEDLLELLSLSEEVTQQQQQPQASSTTRDESHAQCDSSGANNKIGAKDGTANSSSSAPSNQLTELERKKKEKNRKKRAKMLEKQKEYSEIAASEAQSWKSFACKQGLKGVTKRSIFASPCSVKGKVGVGTNGIADAPPAASSSSASSSSAVASARTLASSSSSRRK